MAEPNFKGTDKHGVSIWQLRPSQGTKIDGKRVRVCETFHGTKTEARKRLRELERQIATGIDVSGGRVAFDAYAREWLCEKKRTIQPRTAASYERETERLCSIIGNTPVAEVNAPTVRKALQAVREGIKGRGGGAPSENSVRVSYRVLRLILEQAVKDELLPSNPASKVDAPHAAPRERRTLDFAQYVELQKRIDEAEAAEYLAFEAKETHLAECGHANKERHALRGIHTLSYLQCVRILHQTGMRPSEALALTWRGVDFENRCIHVTQATATAAGGVKPTKTKNGTRTIYLNDYALEALAKWRRFQNAAANKIGAEIGLSDFVVVSDSFTQAHHAHLNRWWNEWRKDAGFDGWELYELRHSQASLLLASGVDIVAVSAQMGHSSLQVTEIYSHALDQRQRELANVLPTA